MADERSDENVVWVTESDGPSPNERVRVVRVSRGTLTVTYGPKHDKEFTYDLRPMSNNG